MIFISRVIFSSSGSGSESRLCAKIRIRILNWIHYKIDLLVAIAGWLGYSVL
jgi:hypothetical protein